jgi:PIN like domain
MPSLRDQFQHFYAPDDDAVATAMQTGLVTPDTNVLLNLYRFQSEARDQLFGALEKLGDRLWIPHQVGLEFHRNRISVIAEQEQYLAQMHFDLEASYEDLRKKVLAFGGRIALGKDRVDELEHEMGRMLGRLDDAVTAAEKANEIHLADRDSDSVLARLEALFEGRVGGAMEPKELEEAKREAKRRADAGIPPGYKDKSKPDPTGDYLVWRQLMTGAKERGLPVVFVTDDKKEDWYRRVHGLTIGARYELREEMMSEAGVPSIIMTTGTFLHHAEKHLNAEVSDETIAQAKELPGLIQARDVRPRNLVGLDRSLKKWLIPNLAKLPPLEGDTEIWRTMFETAMKVSPITGEPEEIDTAAGYITYFLGSGHATAMDITRAGAWMAVRDLQREKREGHDQPATDD